MAEAAAANGIPKRVINNEVAQYTADFAQNPVSVVSQTRFHYKGSYDTNEMQHNLYTEFQPEFDLVVEESNGRVFQ
jgi:uncharacterized protein YdgA (DUF945 family)